MESCCRLCHIPTQYRINLFMKLWIMMIANCKFQNVGLNSVKGHRSYIWKFCLGWVWSLSKVLSVTKSCLEMRWAYIQKGILFSITAYYQFLCCTIMEFYSTFLFMDIFFNVLKWVKLTYCFWRAMDFFLITVQS